MYIPYGREVFRMECEGNQFARVARRTSAISNAPPIHMYSRGGAVDICRGGAL